MDEWETEAFFNGPVVNYVGLTSVPEMRYSVDVGHALRDYARVIPKYSV